MRSCNLVTFVLLALGAATAEGPAAAAKDMVLLLDEPYADSNRTLVVPFVCYSDAHQSMMSSNRCLDLIPTGATISDGRRGQFVIEGRTSFRRSRSGGTQTID